MGVGGEERSQASSHTLWTRMERSGHKGRERNLLAEKETIIALNRGKDDPLWCRVGGQEKAKGILPQEAGVGGLAIG